MIAGGRDFRRWWYLRMWLVRVAIANRDWRAAFGRIKPLDGRYTRHAGAMKVAPRDVESVVWDIQVFREEDGSYAASWETPDGMVAGMGNYSSTPIGALAELCATLIKVAEDEARDRVAETA